MIWIVQLSPFSGPGQLSSVSTLSVCLCLQIDHNSHPPGLWLVITPDQVERNRSSTKPSPICPQGSRGFAPSGTSTLRRHMPSSLLLIAQRLTALRSQRQHSSVFWGAVILPGHRCLCLPTSRTWRDVPRRWRSRTFTGLDVWTHAPRGYQESRRTQVGRQRRCTAALAP